MLTGVIPTFSEFIANPQQIPHGGVIDNAASMAKLTEPLMRVTPRFTNPQGAAVAEIPLGETVWLEFSTSDLRTHRRHGVFSSYFDVSFTGAEFAIAGETEFSQYFWFLQVDPATRGWENVGAAQAYVHSQVDPERAWVLRVPMQFSSMGESTVQLSPGDGRFYEPLMFGIDDIIPSRLIEYGSASLTVIAATGTQAIQPLVAIESDTQQAPYRQAVLLLDTQDEPVVVVSLPEVATSEPSPVSSDDDSADDAPDAESDLVFSQIALLQP